MTATKVNGVRRCEIERDQMLEEGVTNLEGEENDAGALRQAQHTHNRSPPFKLEEMTKT